MMKINHKNKNRHNNKNKNHKDGFFPSNKDLIYKQLFQVDMYVIDYTLALNETADLAADFYTTIFNSVDYTNLLLTFGEVSWQSITFKYEPYFVGSSLVTDFANGVFGIRQGVFDVTVTAKTIASTTRLPGSIQVTNKDKWATSQPVVHNHFFSTSETNTQVSDVPKINYYCNWFNNASTNTSKGLLYIRLVVHARCKVD